MSQERIRTVEQLVKALHEAPMHKGYLRILERVDILPEAFDDLCTWHPKRYTRNCIARTDDFELLLICYEPGQRTSIHDYATEEAWVHPVRGTVVEERFEPGPGGNLRRVSAAKLDRDSFSYLHNGRSIHRYINDSGQRAVTLNLYARPLRTWKVYDERSGGSSIREAGT
ncbi:MAG: cysteine dioxygenase family protein [Flavobacteriales bacterium]|nr:cysteine dioxygenase family protein [Flavobacteriales bacterium]